MNNKLQVIAATEQLEITRLVIDAVDGFAKTTSADPIRDLSKLTLLLQHYADETEVAVLFDLSEYCHEVAERIASGLDDEDAEGRSWRGELRNKLEFILTSAAPKDMSDV